jgi:hypothetical protein
MKRTWTVLAAMLLAVPAAAALPGSYWYAVDHITDVDEDNRILVWAALPPAWHGQEVTIGDIVPEPVAILEDPDTGNRVVEWSVSFDADQPPPLNTFFHFDFEVTEQPLRLDVDPARVGAYDTDSEEYARHTRAETWIQTRGPVLDTTRSIVGDETGVWEQVRLIYDWIVANVKYEVPGPEGRDAESVLEARRGDCEQFSVLMTAMCRSIGIPARTVTNAWNSGGDHVFLEVWTEGYGWVPADPSLGQMLGPGGGGFEHADVERMMEGRGVPVGDPRWLLGNLFDQRIIMIVGNNITVESPTLGRAVTFQSLRSGGKAAQPEATIIEGLNRDVVHGAFIVTGERLADEEAAHAMTHQRLADRFFSEGMVDVVEDVCRQSIERYGDGIMPWINMGRVYMHKGEYYKAEAAFKRAIVGESARRAELLESQLWAHNYLGNCYDLLGMREMALGEYQLVIDRDDNYRGAVDYAKRWLEKPFTKDKVERM